MKASKGILFALAGFSLFSFGDLVIKLLAEILSLPTYGVTIVHGEFSNDKVVVVHCKLEPYKLFRRG